MSGAFGAGAAALLPDTARAQATPDLDALCEVWRVPGVSVAIVQADAIRCTAGGMRRADAPERVDRDTVFGVASLAKSFAAALMADAVVQDRARWSDPVARHVPSFALANEQRPGEATLHHLAAMATGLAPSTDIFRFAMNDRRELVEKLRFLPTGIGLGREMMYSTDNYTALGLATEALEGEDWEVTARRRLWQPLGMARTAVDIPGTLAAGNAASPHLHGEGALPIPWLYPAAAVPAGGVNASASDMGRWLRLLLSSGRSNGQAILADRAIADMMVLQTRDLGRGDVAIFARLLSGEVAIADAGYGYGLCVWRYRGARMAWHTGVTDGFRSIMMLLPAQRFGVVVLANSDRELFPMAVALAAVDRALGVTPPDWSARLLRAEPLVKAMTAAGQAVLTQAALPDGLLGRWHDEGLWGSVQIARDAAGTVLTTTRTVFDLRMATDGRIVAQRRWPYRVPDAFTLVAEGNGLRTSYGNLWQRA